MATMKKPEQYRVRNHTLYYTVLITWGLMDTNLMTNTQDGSLQFNDYATAKAEIMKHAARHGVSNPIILR